MPQQIDYAALAEQARSGRLMPGNIDMSTRPRVKNPDGTTSTVRSISANIDGREVLIPTVSDDGRILSNDDAIETYKRTGKHLGMFDTPDQATAYAQSIHESEAAKLDAPKVDYAAMANQARTLYDPKPKPTPAPYQGDIDEEMAARSLGRQILGPFAGVSDSLTRTVGDLGRGAAKGASSTALTLGKAVQAIPGVKAAVDFAYGTPGLSRSAMAAADDAVVPSNTAQTVGKAGEQLAEVLVPGPALTKAGATVAAKVAPGLAGMVGRTAAELAPKVAVEAAGNAAISASQGGDPTTAAVLGGAAPLAGRFGTQLADALKASATKQVVQALGPTKEHFKALGEKLAPEILKRGIRGSREKIAEQAGAAAEAAGQDIDTALQLFGSRQVDATPVVTALENAKDAFRTTNAAGHVVVFEPRAIKQLDGLQQIVSDLGPDVRVDQLVALRRSWDKVVADAGGFSHRAPGGIGRPLKDISEAANKREATTAIRQLLNADVPELTALNKEFAFWKNLDDVVTQTLQRKQPQAASLTGAVKEAGGMAAGAAMGGGLTAAIGLGKVAKFAEAVFQSPRWKLASAQTKDALADAITKGNASQIAAALSRVMATEGSKVPGALQSAGVPR